MDNGNNKNNKGQAMKLFIFALIFLFAFSAESKITVSGLVTDKAGQPVKKCDVFFNAQAWIDDDSVHVTCDEQGHYSAEIEPGLYNSVYVCDEDLYGKSKLEFWGWNLELNQSQILNAQFDTMEVYSLSAWASNGGSNSIFASFRPMSLTKAKAPNYQQVEMNNKQVAMFDIAPKLNMQAIKGYLDEQPLELIGYNWSYEKVASCGQVSEGVNTSNGCVMPMIIAQFKKPKMVKGLHTLKIDITDSETGDFGQGITHFTSNNKGLGF